MIGKTVVVIPTGNVVEDRTLIKDYGQIFGLLVGGERSPKYFLIDKEF